MAKFLHHRKVLGYFFIRKKNKNLPQIKTRHIFLLSLLFRRYFNIKIAFGEECVKNLQRMILSDSMARIREPE